MHLEDNYYVIVIHTVTIPFYTVSISFRMLSIDKFDIVDLNFAYYLYIFFRTILGTLISGDLVCGQNDV